MLRLLGSVIGGVKAPETEKDAEKAAKLETSEERAERIITAMAAKRAGVPVPEVKLPAERPAARAAVAPETTPRDHEIMDTESAVAGLDGMDGVFYEILGKFVWAWGDTKAHKEELKALGYRWSSDKQKWYWRPATYFKRSKRKWSFEEIEETFKRRAA